MFGSKKVVFIFMLSSFQSHAINWQELWVHPVAAGAAFVPFVYGFMAKSALQLGNPVPRITLAEAFLGGVQAAPTIGGIIALQIFAQEMAESSLSSWQLPEPASAIGSSAFVGCASAPPLIAFNAQTMKSSMLQAMLALDRWQFSATALREMVLMLSIRYRKDFSNSMREQFGDNSFIQYGSIFWGAAACSILVHPADTLLTVWQKMVPRPTGMNLYRGGATRAAAVGGFVTLYSALKDVLSP